MPSLSSLETGPQFLHLGSGDLRSFHVAVLRHMWTRSPVQGLVLAETSLSESASQARGFLASVIPAGPATLGTALPHPACGGTASSSSETHTPPGVSTVLRPPQYYHSEVGEVG